MIQNQTKSKPYQNSLVLAVTGPEAGKFLQGQLTCDVLALEDGQSTLGAYCNIKGKVESLFTLQRNSENYVLLMQQDLLTPTLQELQKYAVFSKVKLELQEQAIAVPDDEQEILAKIPAIYAKTRGEFFAHDLNLPALGAVSFTKGCYRGQEIVARMEHRGNLKRHLYIFQTQQTEIQPGDQIYGANTTPAGTVVRIAKLADKIIGLAVITDAMVGIELHVNNNMLDPGYCVESTILLGRDDKI